jgi:hypothetical protein
MQDLRGHWCMNVLGSWQATSFRFQFVLQALSTERALSFCLSFRLLLSTARRHVMNIQMVCTTLWLSGSLERAPGTWFFKHERPDKCQICQKQACLVPLLRALHLESYRLLKPFLGDAACQGALPRDPRMKDCQTESPFQYAINSVCQFWCIRIMLAVPCIFFMDFRK